MHIYLYLPLNTSQYSAKCLKYIRISMISLKCMKDWWNVYVNKWGREDLDIEAESWFHNLTRIAFSKTLSFPMLCFRTQASMNKVSTWRSDGLLKAEIWHQTCPEKWDNLVWGIFSTGFTKNIHIVNVGAQGRPTNMPQWRHIDYFELKLPRK